MSQLQVSKTEVRKRRSTTAMNEVNKSRKKIAHASNTAIKEAVVAAASNEEKEIDLSEMMTEIKRIAEARRKNEQKARENELRVEKKSRIRQRSRCCACKEVAEVNSDAICACEHSRCALCLWLNSEEF